MNSAEQAVIDDIVIIHGQSPCYCGHNFRVHSNPRFAEGNPLVIVTDKCLYHGCDCAQYKTKLPGVRL